MKAVSTVIIIILILMISVALSALSYMFFTRIYTTVTATTSSAVSQAVTSATALMKIESISINTAYVRNIGQSDLSNFSVYVGDKLASNFTVTPSVVKRGEVGTIKIYDFIKENDEIKITTSQGGLTSKKSPNPCDQAILCLKFDEGSGPTTKDSSPYRNDGTLINMESSDWVSGMSGTALQFDGTNEYVSLPLPTFTEPYTISLWFYPRELNREQTFFYLGGASSFPRFELTASNRLLIYAGNEKYRYGAKVFSSSDLNKWWYVTFMVVNQNDLTTWKIYLNGVDDSDIVGMNTVPYIPPSTTGTIASVSGSISFNGTIDEARIYNKAIY